MRMQFQEFKISDIPMLTELCRIHIPDRDINYIEGVMHGVIVCPTEDIPIEIIRQDVINGNNVYYCRLLKKSTLLTDKLVGDRVYVNVENVALNNEERARNAHQLSIKEPLRAELEIYERVRDKIKEEHYFYHVWDNISNSDFLSMFGDVGSKYINKIVECIKEQNIDNKTKWNNREQYEFQIMNLMAYCFICTDGICIRFGGLMWYYLLCYAYYTRTLQYKINKIRNKVLTNSQNKVK